MAAGSSAATARSLRQAAMLGSEGTSRFVAGAWPVSARSDSATMPGVGLTSGHELMPSVADQVRPAHPAQGLAQHRPIGRIVIPQECLVQPPHLQTLWNSDF